MIIYKKASPLFDYVQAQQASGKSIGFVPTMGALHHGHLSLIALAQQENELTVCSIFVNPTQFNNKDDFEKYPVTIEKDIQQLLEAGCDILFLPTVDQVYGEDYRPEHYDLGIIETIWEGQYRPGHFQGVCQVVDKLFQIVQPTRCYLGQKDYQQCMVIRRLVQLLGLEDKIELRIVPTIREADGLAMSSRNLRLSADQRRRAPQLYQALSTLKSHFSSRAIDELISQAKQQLTAEGFAVDYITIVNANDLSVAGDASLPSVALAAASMGDIRLIDNLLLN